MRPVRPEVMLWLCFDGHFCHTAATNNITAKWLNLPMMLVKLRLCKNV